MTEILLERGINVLSGIQHDVVTEDGLRSEGLEWWCLFLEYGGDKPSLDSCVEEIRSLPGVRRVLLSPANVGKVALDRHHSVPVLGAARLVAFRSDWMVKIFDEIQRRWGEDGARVVYMQGYYGGRESYRFWKGVFDLEGREFVEAVLDLMTTLGWITDWEIVNFDSDSREAVLRVSGSFEAVEPSSKPTCHFLLGVTTGLLSEMLGEPLFGIETKCEARGDVSCEFVIKKKPFVFQD